MNQDADVAMGTVIQGAFRGPKAAFAATQPQNECIARAFILCVVRGVVCHGSWPEGSASAESYDAR